MTGGRYFVVADIPPALGDLTPVPEGESFQSMSTTVDVTSEDQTVRMAVAVRSTPTEEPSVSDQPAELPAPQRAAAPRFAIGDRVWTDIDRSGHQDPGEPPAKGISVQLLNGNGRVVDSTRSSASGHYVFDLVPAGMYSIRFAGVPSGSKLAAAGQGGSTGLDSDPDYTGETAPFTLGVGEPNVREAVDSDDVDAEYINPTIDAGITPLRFGAAGRVWLDVNHDGIQQTDEPPATTTVTLLSDDRTVLATTVTDAQGGYQFDDLAKGRYQIAFSGLPPHRTFVPARTGSDPGTDSAPNPRTGLTPIFKLEPNAPNLAPATDVHRGGADFVNVSLNAGLVGVYSLGDTVWRDNNGDNVLDAGDAGVKGVTAELVDAAGALLGTKVTNSNGRFTFDGLPAGSYRVRFTDVPQGLVFVAQRVGPNSAVDSDVDVDGRTDLVALGDENPADTTIDAGLTTPASLRISAVTTAVSAPTDATLSSTGGVAPEIPVSGLALVLGGLACLVVGRRRNRLH